MKRLTSKDSIETYEGKLDKKEYFRILKKINQKLVKQIIKDGEEYLLPHGLGSFQVLKFRPGRRLVDFKATKEYGFTVYKDYMETGGWATKFFWSKAAGYFHNQKLWSFSLTRHNQRLDKDSLTRYTETEGLYHYYEL